MEIVATSVQVEEQPLEVRLAAGTPLHDQVLKRLNERIIASEAFVRQRHDDWQEVDEHLRCYQDLRRPVKLGDKSEDRTKKEMPWGRSIEIPTEYVLLWTRALLMTQVLDRPPQVQGRGPEDLRGSYLVETALQYDLDQSRHRLNLFQACFDASRYGVTFWNQTWAREEGWLREQAPIGAGAPSWLALAARYPSQRWGLRREYNHGEVIDPYMALPDPRYPVAAPQEALFAGYSAFRAFMDLWADRKQPNGTGIYFNLEKCRQFSGLRSSIATGRDTTGQFDAGALAGGTDDPGVLRLRHIQERLVPRWWGLGDSENVERWWFTVAAPAEESQGVVIIRAHPAGYEHGESTIHSGQDHPDLHAPWTPGAGELAAPLARMGNWLVNSHVANVMATLYAMVLADTSLVEEFDLTHPEPGRVVRLTPEGSRLVRMGHPIGNFLHQMQTSNVTQGNVGLAQQLFTWGQRMFAVNDTMQGLPTADKRTLGEIQLGTGSASQHVAMNAKLLDDMMFKGIFTQMIANRQEFTSMAQWYRITGALAKRLGSDHVMIHPSDLAGNYDYRPITATMPADPASMMDTWLSVLKVGAGIPGLLQPGPDGRVLDTRAVFEQIAQAAGINSIDQFFVSVRPAEELARDAEAGNVVPLPPGAQPSLMPGMRPGRMGVA